MSDAPSPLVPPGVGDVPDDIFRTIVDGTGHPFVVIAPDGSIRYAGGSITSVIGWYPEDLVGRSMADLLPPDQLAIAIDAVAEIEAIDRAGAGVPMVFEVLRPDRTTTWCEIGAMPLLDVPGVEAIVLRLRRWDTQHHFDAFVSSLLADEALDDVLPSLCRSIAASVEAEGAAIHHGLGPDGYAGVAAAGVPLEWLRADEGPWIDVHRTDDDRPLHVDAADVSSAAAAAGFSACWVVAVGASPGLAPAAVSVWRRAPGPPLIGHRHVLGRSIQYARLAIVRNAEHRRLRHLAGHDSLTGVANRSEFRDQLAAALAIGERDLAVAFCDLDDFKPVNDRFGHSVGDAVLVEVAARLRRSLRAGDELARLGGDEFTVLLRNVADPPAARHVGERLLAATREPFAVGTKEAADGVSIGLSAGIALPRRGETAASLLDRADAALYEAKRAGGRRVRVAD